MEDMFQSAQVFGKNIRDVFAKANSERSKCPRCKGTGLLKGRQFWVLNQPPPSNDPCWFCEGVGVMPIVGLSGFMLGRSQPKISTRNFNPRPPLPIKVQLYLGKYPDTKCTLKTYKPSSNLSDLLFDPYHFPSWMDALLSRPGDDNDQVDRADSLSFASNSSTNSSSRIPQQQPSQTRTRATFRIRVPVAPHIPRRRSISTSKKPQLRPGRSLNPQSVSSLPPNQLNESDEPEIIQPSSKRFSGTRPTNSREKNPVVTSSHNSAAHSSRSSTRRGRSEDRDVRTSKSPVLRSPRTSRSPRRDRNRVREEAEKEAVERACKFQQPSTSHFEQGASIPSDSSAGSTWSTGKANEMFGNWFLGDGVNPWKRMVTSSKQLSSDFSTINQFLYGKVREGIFPAPTLGKPF